MDNIRRWVRDHDVWSGVRKDRMDLVVQLRIVSAIVGISMAFACLLLTGGAGDAIVLGIFTFIITEYIVYCCFDCFRIEKFLKLYAVRWAGCILSLILLISGVVMHFAIGTEEPFDILIMELLFAVSQIFSVRGAIRASKYNKYDSVH